MRQLIAFDHGAFDLPICLIYLAVVIGVAAVGLVTCRPNVQRPLAIAAGAAALIVTARNVTWDYYLADVFFFSFFAVAPGPSEPQRRPAAIAFTAAAVLFSLCFVVHFKAKYDRAYALGTLGRRALERGLVSPAEASFLPFGLMGWYYFPYYSQHDGRTSADLAAFGDRMKQNTHELAVRYPWPLRRLPAFRSALPADRTAAVIEDRFDFCWFTYADYRLLRAAPAQVRAGRGPFPEDFKLPVFPADDEGWWQLAQSAR